MGSDCIKIAKALASLGHEARLKVFRLLVRSGHEGLTVSELQHHLDMPASTLAHHLRTLVLSGLVVQDRKGREIYNRPDFDVMETMMAFLNEECCAGVSLASSAA